MTTTRSNRRTKRSLRVFATASLWMCIVGILVACSAQGVWFHARTPTIFLHASARCPSSVGNARDVRNPGGSNQQLVPVGINPIRGLICIYSGALQSSARVRQIVLNRSAATRLSTAMSKVSLQAPPSGAVHCPDDTGGFAIIALASRGSPDINIWWAMTGCQALDNGIVGATQIANNSFAGFSNTVGVLIG